MITHLVCVFFLYLVKGYMLLNMQCETSKKKSAITLVYKIPIEIGKYLNSVNKNGCCFLRSPKMKAQVSFSDPNLLLGSLVLLTFHVELHLIEISSHFQPNLHSTL